MSQSDQQFQVRIKIGRKESKDQLNEEGRLLADQQAGYTYHYFRIFGVITLVSCISWGIFNLYGDSLSAAVPDDLDLVDNALPVESTDSIKSSENLGGNELDLNSLDVLETTVVADINTLTEKQPSAAIKQSNPSDSSTSQKVALAKRWALQMQAAETKILQQQKSLTSVPVLSQAQAKTGSENTATLTSTPDIASKSSSVSALQVIDQAITAKTALVNRVQFAKAIKNKEPVGEGSEVISGSDGVAKLIFFTELKGLKDQFVTHTWIHEGRVEAKVKIGVWSNNYRCYSSKYLTKNKTGRWQVKVEDSQGKQLAMGEFDYRS